MSVSREELVEVRGVDPGDKSFIMATWLKGLRYGCEIFKEIPSDIYFKNYHRILESILTNPETEIRVACLKDDRDVILGYSVSKDNALHFIFVKSEWRQIGIAKSLVSPKIDTVTHLTKVGSSILKKHPKIVFNPFALN